MTDRIVQLLKWFLFRYLGQLNFFPEICKGQAIRLMVQPRSYQSPKLLHHSPNVKKHLSKILNNHTRSAKGQGLSQTTGDLWGSNAGYRVSIDSKLQKKEHSMTKERIPPSAVCSIFQALVYSTCQTINILEMIFTKICRRYYLVLNVL